MRLQAWPPDEAFGVFGVCFSLFKKSKAGRRTGCLIRNLKKLVSSLVKFGYENVITM